MQTKSGKHTIYQIEEFLPGRKVPPDWERDVLPGGPFFFLPTKFNEEDGWGNPLANRRGYPLPYSRGYPSAELALEDAEEYEEQHQPTPDPFNWMEKAETFQV